MGAPRKGWEQGKGKGKREVGAGRQFTLSVVSHTDLNTGPHKTIFVLELILSFHVFCPKWKYFKLDFLKMVVNFIIIKVLNIKNILFLGKIWE